MFPLLSTWYCIFVASIWLNFPCVYQTYFSNATTASLEQAASRKLLAFNYFYFRDLLFFISFLILPRVALISWCLQIELRRQLATLVFNLAFFLSSLIDLDTHMRLNEGRSLLRSMIFSFVWISSITFLVTNTSLAFYLSVMDELIIGRVVSLWLYGNQSHSAIAFLFDGVLENGASP